MEGEAAPEISQELYVFDLDPAMTEALLCAYFEKFGKVCFLFFCGSSQEDQVDEFTKKERYGFLKFESASAMNQMMALGERHTVAGFPPFGCRISKATTKNDGKYVPNQG
jgi:hypothetical protein